MDLRSGSKCDTKQTSQPRLDQQRLNSRNELTSCCRHARKFLLKNVIILSRVTSHVTRNTPNMYCIVLNFQIFFNVTVFSGSRLIASHEA